MGRATLPPLSSKPSITLCLLSRNPAICSLFWAWHGSSLLCFTSKTVTVTLLTKSYITTSAYRSREREERGSVGCGSQLDIGGCTPLRTQRSRLVSARGSGVEALKMAWASRAKEPVSVLTGRDMRPALAWGPMGAGPGGDDDERMQRQEHIHSRITGRRGTERS